MHSSIVRFAILAYPKRWRRRYGTELERLTVSVLEEPHASARKLWIVFELVLRGIDERVRRTESRGIKAALTSSSALVVGMFALAGGLASDAVFVPNVQLSASVHFGSGVRLSSAARGNAGLGTMGAVGVFVPAGPDPQVSVGARSAVAINTKSGLVTSVTRTGDHARPR
jgi:hypothetical protein